MSSRPFRPPPDGAAAFLVDARDRQRDLLRNARGHCLAAVAVGLSTVVDRLSRVRDFSVFERINHPLVMTDRERVGQGASPTAAIIDSQSVKTTEAGGPRSYGMRRNPFPPARTIYPEVIYNQEEAIQKFAGCVAAVVGNEIARPSLAVLAGTGQEKRIFSVTVSTKFAKTSSRSLPSSFLPVQIRLLYSWAKYFVLLTSMLSL